MAKKSGKKGKSSPDCKVFNMKRPLTAAEVERLIKSGQKFRVFKEAATLRTKADIEAWLEGECKGQIGTLNAPFRLRTAPAAA